MLRGLFARKAGRAEPGREDVDRLKRLTREALALDDCAEVTASEISCFDPDCLGTETVILVMEPGRPTWAAKVRKAAADVTEPELRAALVEARRENTG